MPARRSGKGQSKQRKTSHKVTRQPSTKTEPSPQLPVELLREVLKIHLKEEWDAFEERSSLADLTDPCEYCGRPDCMSGWEPQTETSDVESIGTIDTEHFIDDSEIPSPETRTSDKDDAFASCNENFASAVFALARTSNTFLDIALEIMEHLDPITVSYVLKALDAANAANAYKSGHAAKCDGLQKYTVRGTQNLRWRMCPTCRREERKAASNTRYQAVVGMLIEVQHHMVLIKMMKRLGLAQKLILANRQETSLDHSQAAPTMGSGQHLEATTRASPEVIVIEWRRKEA
ncbi:MAG: hypothetical protein Q9162_006392 [Coniocarpon cinnabarinum]